ncbi:hypothetical protein M758_8G092900 [Ceratodon purpureus]|nr:hypothetical protein M758_8G092900 [Ceratodon purpureus]KAG0608270.1 hypothetical protein M758_8G092900 [Ceratodon purpureus]KAG0608271.1 hypothetical protein M758_8G092900 [Ceratodon purpureus]
MKLFGWGKSKEILPQTVLQQVKNSDPRNSRHGLDRGTSMGPKMPCKGTSTGVIRNKQQGLFGVDDDGYLHGASTKQKVNSSGQDAKVCDEKLQDTIRFVFSHEQEGLLAIGTFALEQLTAVRNAIDEHQKAVAAGGHAQDQDGFESCTGMMQSSDDEVTPPRSWLANPGKKTFELPVCGSDGVYTSGVESEAERGTDEEGPMRAFKGINQSKALTFYKSSGNRTPIAGVKPIVLLTALPPELRKVFDPANLLYRESQLPNFVPHWTDSVPPPVLARVDGPCADDESYYTSRFCGLFGSKKKSSSHSKRLSKRGTVHYVNEEVKELSTKVIDQDAKKSMLSFGSNGMPSLGKLAKMWRSSCKQSSARIAPERNPSSPRPSQEFKGPPCAANGIEKGEVFTAPAPQLQSQSVPRRLPTGACSPKVEEFRRRVAMQQERNNVQASAHSGEVVRDGVGSNRDDGGHWIKTDSEFVVLEM